MIYVCHSAISEIYVIILFSSFESSQALMHSPCHTLERAFQSHFLFSLSYFLLPWVGLTTFLLPIFLLPFFLSPFRYNPSSLFQCSVRLPGHCSPLTRLRVLFLYHFLPHFIVSRLLAITTIHSCAFMIVNSPILFCSQHFQKKEKKRKKNKFPFFSLPS